MLLALDSVQLCLQRLDIVVSGTQTIQTSQGALVLLADITLNGLSFTQLTLRDTELATQITLTLLGATCMLLFSLALSRLNGIVFTLCSERGFSLMSSGVVLAFLNDSRVFITRTKNVTVRVEFTDQITNVDTRTNLNHTTCRYVDGLTGGWVTALVSVDIDMLELQQTSQSHIVTLMQFVQNLVTKVSVEVTDLCSSDLHALLIVTLV